MTRSEFTVGARVKICRDVEIFPIGIFRAGLLGTVTDYDSDVPPDWGWDLIGHVRLDEHRPELAAWDNNLQVWGNDASCTLSNFILHVE